MTSTLEHRMTTTLEHVATLAARAGGSVVRQVRSVLEPGALPTAGAAVEPASRWLVVTVYRERAEIDTGNLPAPLAEYGDEIEVLVREAADAKGTELGARLRTPPPSGISGAAAKVRGDDPRAKLRSALRRAKQLLEVGEVLKVDPVPHGKRSATPGGLVLEAVTRRADREGVL
ncbi:hypothetical protein [Geodermatophilus ruber]|uniref:Uncharacterized protein n=1 Tax=Geodermatophilus ruber TaxID=504800 RepID=A0A1I4ADK8_9ACTN|nr:hypothetical protein [Geodermatophilus ruber]SFK53866.1 hypothetical protein SAMN04488085_102165 [Geodermatophilus ruber]